MISKTGRHAIMALVALAESPTGVFAGAADIAQEIGAPPNYLGKLLKTLAKAGLVESKKGKGGGFRLARDPDTISLLEAVEPIDNLRRWSDCLLGRELCGDDEPCAVHGRWKKVRKVYLQFLEETTIADLIKNSKP